jgi:hypothetical protein
MQGSAPVLDLQLPDVDAEHVIVQCDDQICHANATSRAQPEDLWRSLEGPLLSGGLLVHAEDLQWIACTTYHLRYEKSSFMHDTTRNNT